MSYKKNIKTMYEAHVVAENDQELFEEWLISMIALFFSSAFLRSSSMSSNSY